MTFKNHNPRLSTSPVTHADVIVSAATRQPKKRGRPVLSLEEKAKAREARLHEQLARVPHLPDSAYVRAPVVQALFACSAATLWRRVTSKAFPAPHKLSERCSAWLLGDVRRALSSFAAAAA